MWRCCSQDIMAQARMQSRDDGDQQPRSYHLSRNAAGAGWQSRRLLGRADGPLVPRWPDYLNCCRAPYSRTCHESLYRRHSVYSLNFWQQALRSDTSAARRSAATDRLDAKSQVPQSKRPWLTLSKSRDQHEAVRKRGAAHIFHSTALCGCEFIFLIRHYQQRVGCGVLAVLASEFLCCQAG